MTGRIGIMLWSVALFWTTPATAAFSANNFLSAIERSGTVAELERAEAMAKNDPEQKKTLRSLRQRLSREKRRVDGMIREVKPLALKAQNRSNVNLQDASGCTLLMHAARFSNAKAIDILLQENADLLLKDKKGHTALYYDKNTGSGILAERLAETIDAAIDQTDFDKVSQYCKAGLPADTPLQDGPLVGKLLQKEQFSLVLELLSCDTLENFPMKDGTLLSELMVQCGNPDILKRGAKLFGKELWHHSVGRKDSLLSILRSGNLQAVQLYVHHLGSDNNLSALAVRHSTPEVVTWILKNEAAANKADTWGSFPLFEAARRGNPAVYEAVLAAGGDVNMRNNAGETLLMHAALSGNTNIVQAVLQKMNAELLNSKDNAGRTALDYARMSGNAMVESLLRTSGIQEGNKQQ